MAKKKIKKLYEFSTIVSVNVVVAASSEENARKALAEAGAELVLDQHSDFYGEMSDIDLEEVRDRKMEKIHLEAHLEAP